MALFRGEVYEDAYVWRLVIGVFKCGDWCICVGRGRGGGFGASVLGGMTITYSGREGEGKIVIGVFGGLGQRRDGKGQLVAC